MPGVGDDYIHGFQPVCESLRSDKGNAFAVTVRAPTEDKAISQEQMLADAGQTLAEFESDYVRMAK